MKKLDKINNISKKYTPLIGLLGFLMVVGGFVYNFYQLSFLKEELEITKSQIYKEDYPKWRTNIIWNEGNTLIDQIEFGSVNPNYNIQKVKIILVDKATPKYYPFIGSTWKTYSFKKELTKIFDEFNPSDCDCNFVVRDKKFPIGVNITYEYLGITKDTTMIYEYHFDVFSSKGRNRIKTKGLEFIKYLGFSDEDFIISEIVDYNLNNSFYSKLNGAERVVKLEVVLKDSLYQVFSRLIKINYDVGLYEFSLRWQGEPDEAKDYLFYFPTYFFDSTLLVEKNHLLNEINKMKLDTSIVNNLKAVNNSEAAFERVYYNIVEFDSISVVYTDSISNMRLATYLNWTIINDKLLEKVYRKAESRSVLLKRKM